MCSLSVQVLCWTTLNTLLLGRAFLPLVYTHFVHRFITEALWRTANLSGVSRYTGESRAPRQLALAAGLAEPGVQTRALTERRRVSVWQARRSAACCLNIPCWCGWSRCRLWGVTGRLSWPWLIDSDICWSAVEGQNALVSIVLSIEMYIFFKIFLRRRYMCVCVSVFLSWLTVWAT